MHCDFYVTNFLINVIFVTIDRIQVENSGLDNPLLNTQFTKRIFCHWASI